MKWMHLLCGTSRLTFSERFFTVGDNGKKKGKNFFFFENMGLIIQSDMQM